MMRQFYAVRTLGDGPLQRRMEGWVTYANSYSYDPDHTVNYRSARDTIVLICLPNRSKGKRRR